MPMPTLGTRPDPSTLAAEWRTVAAEGQRLWTAYCTSAGRPEEGEIERRWDEALARREGLEAAILAAPAATPADALLRLEIACRLMAEARPADAAPDETERFAVAALADLERLLATSAGEVS